MAGGVEWGKDLYKVGQERKAEDRLKKSLKSFVKELRIYSKRSGKLQESFR